MDGLSKIRHVSAQTPPLTRDVTPAVKIDSYVPGDATRGMDTPEATPAPAPPKKRRGCSQAPVFPPLVHEFSSLW